MLDPDLFLESVVLAFRSIPTVVDEMSGDPLPHAAPFTLDTITKNIAAAGAHYIIWQ